MDIFAEIEMEGAPNAPPLPNTSINISNTADPIRQKFYDMRGIAPDNPYTWSDARLFYKQAKFMENFTDDYEGFADFSMHYPCFQRMGYERLRTYFTWRTSARRDDFLPIGLSYVFLYVYELLMCIGVKEPAEALARLSALREKFPALNEYFPMWLKDFDIYYNFENPAEIFSYSCRDDLAAWNKLSSYDIEKSKFYTAENKLIQDCFTAVIQNLSALCEEKNIRLKDLFVNTGKEEIPWQPFRRALFHPWLKQADRITELPCGETFYCRNNVWTTLYSAPYSHRKDLIGFIIKKTEACTRDASDYKRITADTSSIFKANAALTQLDITPADIANQIEQAAARFFREKNRIIVNISHKNLERIREEADDITDKLVVEECACAVRTPDFEEPSPQTEQHHEQTSDCFVLFKQSLSAAETEALKIISESGDNAKIKSFSDENGIMLEILVDSINEKAMDTIGDNVLDFSDTLSVYEEYTDLL
jgi:hypothetical protein